MKKSYIVEEFKNNACILIGTEAAAEGINLQFCSLLVNYDMPWNPQRIEQRIGRCHRYGQKNDVVVLNFVNEHNEADKHVYELLDQKFKLFDGLFGSSDEVLGSLENGIDFETRIAEIYQNCRTTDEIQAAFDELQDLYKDKIESSLTRTRQSILENFDEDVRKLLKVTDDTTKTSLNRFETWLYYFLLYAAPDSQAISDTEISANAVTYNLRWRDVSGNNEVFMRKDEPYIHSLLENAVNNSLPVAEVCFDYSSSGRKFSYFESMPVRTGWLRVDKLTVEAFDIQEYIINTCVCDDGTVLDDDTVFTEIGDRKYFKTIKDGSGNDIVIYSHSGYQTKSVRQLAQDDGISEIEAFNKYYELICTTENAQTSIRTRVREATDDDDNLYSIDYYPISGRNKGKLTTVFFVGKNKRLVSWFNTERVFATVLENDNDVLRWLCPNINQFNIYYDRNSGRRYQPDFVVETKDMIYMVETKDARKVNGDIDDVVLAKSKAAMKYCSEASAYNAQNSGKPWKYVLISSANVHIQSSLKFLVENSVVI